MHIDDEIQEKAKSDASFAIAYALLQLASAQRQTALAIKNLDIQYIGERIDVGLGAVASAISGSSE